MNLAKRTYGQFEIGVPAGWMDESTITLVAPLKQGLAAPLTGKAAPRFRSNVTITFETKPDGIQSAEAYLSAMDAGLRSAGARVDLVGTETFSLGRHVGAMSERKVVLAGKAVRQFTAVAFVGANVIVASASTSESAATRERGMLLEMLGQVDLQS